MFGSRGLRTGRKFFAIWWHEQLVLKLPAASAERLIAAGDAQPFDPMEGRRMNGWVLLQSGTDWPALSHEARTWVESQQA